jgi:HEAT repeat protein
MNKHNYIVYTRINGAGRYLVEGSLKYRRQGNFKMRWDGNKTQAAKMARSSAYEWAAKMGGVVRKLS